MKNLKKLLALLLALVMVASMLAACGGEEAPADETKAPSGNEGEQSGNEGDSGNTGTSTENKKTGVGGDKEIGNYGGHLNVCIKSRPVNVDYVKATNSWNHFWSELIYEPFLTRDADNNIVPCVCDFELSEDQTDLKLWPREGYILSHGYGQVDVYDLEASFNRGLTMLASAKKYVKPNVVSVSVENDGEKDYLHVVFKEYNELNMYYIANTIPWWAVTAKEVAEKYASTNIMTQLDDAIGTGPYVVVDLQDSIQVTVEKRDDYIPVDNSMYTGAAGTKYGYMDSITCWYNGQDDSAAMALMSGSYDMTEAVPTSYLGMAEESGVIYTAMPSNQRTWVYFNTVGDTLCRKYPSLRKAVLAAINYNDFLDVITDSSMKFDQELIVDEKYATDVFKNMDYYGDDNQEVVDKYLNEARAAGYNDEPLQLYFSSGRTDVPTCFRQYLEAAGINYEMNIQDPTATSAVTGDPSNNFDFYFGWGVSAYTPSLLSDALMVDLFDDARKDELLAQMRVLEPGCDEYMALWAELSTLMAEGAYIGWLSAIDWWWWHPKDLNLNNDEGLVRFVYNTYWDDPEQHPKGVF